MKSLTRNRFGTGDRNWRSLDRATGHLKTFPVQLTPDLASAINTKILLEHPLDLQTQDRIALRQSGQQPRIAALRHMGVGSRSPA